jgi:hypothetical protein
MPVPVKSSSLVGTLSWAVYLGCSWTWCIGMFLPALLVSEFGNAAWFVFAIPNVIGAAAMGWTLARPGSSERMVAEHRSACIAFSAVTLAFHFFFLYWLTTMHWMPSWFAIIAVIAGLIFGLTKRRLGSLDFVAAWLVLGVSLAVFYRGLTHPVFGVADAIEKSRAVSAMIGLAPICLLGFLLCPYLDVTFHRARQQTAQAAGKTAFAVGFGVVFLLMIVLTFMYTGDLALDKNVEDRFGSFGGALLISWVALHIAGQSGFTIAAHLRAVPGLVRRDLILWVLAAGMAAISICCVHQQKWFDFPGLNTQMTTGEFIYRLFMSFYGLVFPAYVWMFIVPIACKTVGRSRSTVRVWIGSLLMAAPMFWMGFVNEWMLWLIPGVMVLLAARFVAEQVERRPTELVGTPLHGHDVARSSRQ